MSIDLNDCDDEDGDMVVADSITVDICEHGNAQIGLWFSDDHKPFAVAYVGPAAVVDLIALLTRNVRVEGHA